MFFSDDLVILQENRFVLIKFHCICRYSLTKAICIAFVMTFFSVFDIPVFWPILLLYWIVLFVLTMKRQLRHMIKYKYVPFDFGKQVNVMFFLLPFLFYSFLVYFVFKFILFSWWLWYILHRHSVMQGRQQHLKRQAFLEIKTCYTQSMRQRVVMVILCF